MTLPEQQTIDPEITGSLSQVNRAKEELSSAYKVWYEAPSQEKEQLEESVIEVRDEIFNGLTTSSGRKFTEILFTPEELAEKNRYVFNQKDVSNYHSEKATKERSRGLVKGVPFDPVVVLGDIVPTAHRESREEGLNRASYEKMLQWEVVKRLVTSGCSPIDVLSGMAKANQLSTKKSWIDDDEWVGENKLDDDQIDIKLAQKMAQTLDLDLDELITHHERVLKINGSAPTYINNHYQHIIPSAQGGLSQRPLGIASHWFEHMQVANDSFEALEVLLPIYQTSSKEEEITQRGKAVKRLTELTFFAYQLNAQAAELLRSSIPLSPSLSTKYILQKREEICSNAKDILEKTESIDSNNAFSLLSDLDKKNILSLAGKIKNGRGRIDPEDNPQDAPTLGESIALAKLNSVVEEIDCSNAVNKLKNSINSLGKYKSKTIEKEHIENILGLIDRLEKNRTALYLNMLSQQEYNSIIELQNTLNKEILLDIVVPYKIRNVRPAWRYRLDLEKMGDILVNPYDDKGLELRMLCDVLQEPNFRNIFKTNGAPRRVGFTKEQLDDPSTSEKVYGDLRYIEMLQGLVANNMLNRYFESANISDKELLDAMFPDKDNEQPPSALQNVDKAADMVYEAIVKDKKIATIGDCDQDGFFSSINWRWTLEHMGVKELEQKFNTRIEGHAVQPVDLLNLAVQGSELIIVNDTGSSEQDANTFRTIKEGAKGLPDLEFFRDNIELISGYTELSEHVQREIKRKLTELIRHSDIFTYDPEDVLESTITTGNTYIDEKGKTRKEYMKLGDFQSLTKYINGFKDLQIIVCDHHTSNIPGIRYFKDQKDVVMVNPQWVRQGYEDTFINEMTEALKPNDKGEVNIEEIDKIQRKYICYPQSDIVGTVTATKVMKRVMQLFSPDEIVRADASEFYPLSREERIERYQQLAKEVSFQDASLNYRSIPLPNWNKIDINLESLWLERDPFEKVETRISQVLNSLQYKIEEIKRERDVTKAISDLEELEKRYSVTLGKKENLVNSIFNHSFVLTKQDVKQFASIAMEDIEDDFKRNIEVVQDEKIITDSELRFYLEYANRLPKSIFEMEREEKEEYVKPYIRLIAEELETRSPIYANDDDFEVSIVDTIDEMVEEGKSLRDIKMIYFDLIQQGYEENGGVPENSITGETPNERTKVRYEGNKRWNSAINSLLRTKRITPDLLRGLNSYFEYGGHGLEFLHLTQATATLGDGGSVGIDGGLENRSIVKNGMKAIEKFADDYWDAESKEEKDEMKRIQPEILRLIRTSLRGTHIKSINWNLSRLLTHGVSAFVNSMYRRAKEERPGRAKEFWKEAADFCVLRSDNESNQRHRHTLIYAQEISVERREDLLKNLVKELESKDEELEKPIIISQLDGRKFVDPVKGLRGLIAGELAQRYDKPAMVVVEEKKESDKGPGRYSVSFRLPAKGNIATDMVQLGLQMNPVKGVDIVAHGGHPEASGGTWEVYGGIEKMHEVLDPIYSQFKVSNPDAGIVKIEEVIENTVKEAQKDGWSDIEEYKEHIDAFDIADTIAKHMYKQTNPYGSDMPPLLVEFEDLTIVSIARGTKNDGDDYFSLTVKDKRGHTKNMRLFKDLEDFSKIQKGDVLTVRAQPIMRLRALEPSNLEYKLNDEFRPTVVTGSLAKPNLDIVKILDIKRVSYNPQLPFAFK